MALCIDWESCLIPFLESDIKSSSKLVFRQKVKKDKNFDEITYVLRNYEIPRFGFIVDFALFNRDFTACVCSYNRVDRDILKILVANFDYIIVIKDVENHKSAHWAAPAYVGVVRKLVNKFEFFKKPLNLVDILTDRKMLDNTSKKVIFNLFYSVYNTKFTLKDGDKFYNPLPEFGVECAEDCYTKTTTSFMNLGELVRIRMFEMCRKFKSDFRFSKIESNLNNWTVNLCNMLLSGTHNELRSSLAIRTMSGGLPYRGMCELLLDFKNLLMPPEVRLAPGNSHIHNEEEPPSSKNCYNILDSKEDLTDIDVLMNNDGELYTYAYETNNEDSLRRVSFNSFDILSYIKILFNCKLLDENANRDDIISFLVNKYFGLMLFLPFYIDDKNLIKLEYDYLSKPFGLINEFVNDLYYFKKPKGEDNLYDDITILSQYRLDRYANAASIYDGSYLKKQEENCCFNIDI